MLGQASSHPDLADLDRLDASLDHLMSYRYEPGANQAAQHPLCDAVSKHQRFGSATLVDEQFQRPARFPAETTFSKGCRHSWSPNRPP